MKMFRVAVAVAIALTFLCIQQSSAVPVAEVQQLEELMSVDNPVTDHEKMSLDSWKMPFNNREKRGIKCKFCCGCCFPGVCGVCCRF